MLEFKILIRGQHAFHNTIVEFTGLHQSFA